MQVHAGFDKCEVTVYGPSDDGPGLVLVDGHNEGSLRRFSVTFPLDQAETVAREILEKIAKARLEVEAVGAGIPD